MTEVESKFIIMARIAVELGRQGLKVHTFIDMENCGLVTHGVLHVVDGESKTEQELLDWLEELQEQNNVQS